MVLLLLIAGSHAHSSPLPLLSLSAQQSNKDALLAWHAEDEGSITYYEVERSADTKVYQPLGRVNAAGAGKAHTYWFKDEKAEETGKTFYYRLKAVDVDRNVTYTPVVRVSFSTMINAVSVFPNPIDRPATLQVTLARPGHVEVRVTDNGGRLVRHSDYQLPDGISLLPFDPNGLPRGIYYMEIHGAFSDKVIRFVRP